MFVGLWKVMAQFSSAVTARLDPAAPLGVGGGKETPA